jgi:tetratricopeptide (TPR) repeat protein
MASILCSDFELTPDSFWGVFWVDLSNQSTAQSGFLAVAKALGSSAETYEDSLQVLACATQRWLLILDNADEPHFDYATYFPSGNRGSIIMTSRNPMCRQYSTIGAVALEGLDITHSTQLLLKAAQISEVSWPSHTVISHNIIKLLGSHTLALIQAGAYISAGYCRLDQYAERFQQHRRQLLEHYPDQQRSRYSDVYATFEASADALKRSQGESALDALSLLGILSMLHSSVLPLQLFQDAWAGAKLVLQREPTTFDVIRLQQAPRRSRRFQLPWVSSKQKPVHEALSDQDIDRLQEEHVSRLPEFLGVQLQHWSDHRLKRARALLVSLSLVTMHQTNEDDGLSMHPLVHAWARDRQDVKHQQHAWISTACTIAFSRGISNLWRSNKELLRPHLQVLIPPVPLVLFSYETPQLMLPILLHCGWILNVTWEQKILQQLLNSVYQALNITPENVIEEYMPIWRLAASVAVSLSRTVLAIFLLERITTWDQIALAEADPIRLASQYNLGRAYNINGQPEKAISILENTAINYKKIDTHRDWLLSTLYELNGAYNATGRSQKAVTLLKEVIEEQGSAPGNERTHDKLRSQHALATAYIAAGQATTAVTLLEHVIEMYERLVDEMHPDRLNAQHELARAYKFDGKSEKSVHLLKHIISVQKQSVDKTDYLLLASQYSLGTQYLTAKETSEAVILLEHVVKMYDFVLEETQSERLNAKYALALAYVDARELDKALMLMRHVVQVRKTTLESVHPHRVASERLLSDLENETVYD